jgi:hypothetical protein
MINWLKTWFLGYNVAFQSPYPIEVCRQILLDQSRSDYFENNLAKWLVGFKKSNLLFADVYKKTDDVQQFTLEKDFAIGNRANLKVAIVGQLERTPHGTLVMTNTQIYMHTWIYWTAFISITLAIGLGLIAYGIGNLSNSMFNLTMHLPWIGIVLGFLIWQMGLIRAIHQFTRFPENLLEDTPKSHPSEIMPPPKDIPNREFNFYSTESLAVCMRKLTESASKEHYQKTIIGMIRGVSTLEGLFIGFMEDSPTHTYFVIERDNLFGTNRTPIQTIGLLQPEGDGTRITGFTQNPKNNSDTLILLVLLGLIIIGIFNLLTMIITVITVRSCFAIVTNKVIAQNATYPARKILGEKKGLINNNGKLRWLKYKFDFHSPYPIEDCHNMLLAYTEKKDEHYTQWGLVAGNVINKWLFITIREHEVNHRDFLIQSIDKNEIIPPIIGFGTLQTEGYGTRITGYSHSPNGWWWLFNFTSLTAIVPLGLVLCFTLQVTSSFELYIIFGTLVFFMMGISAYLWQTSRIQLAGEYAQQVLGAKSARKRKLADDADFE